MTMEWRLWSRPQPPVRGWPSWAPSSFVVAPASLLISSCTSARYEPSIHNRPAGPLCAGLPTTDNTGEVPKDCVCCDKDPGRTNKTGLYEGCCLPFNLFSGYVACDSNCVCCAKGEAEFLCLEGIGYPLHTACLATDEKRLPWGLLPKKNEKSICRLSLGCCICGLKKPEYCVNQWCRCWCCVEAQSCPMNENAFVKEPNCTLWALGLCCGINVLPVCGCCKPVPHPVPLKMTRLGDGVDSFAAHDRTGERRRMSLHRPRHRRSR